MIVSKFLKSFSPLILLTVSLLGGCKKETVVKNYESSSCSGSESLKLTKNVASLASSYLIFNTASTRPDFAEVALQGNHALGKTKLNSQTFSQEVTSRLTQDSSNFAIKVFSLLELAESTEESQILKFSKPCQMNEALLENEALRSEPRGVFYLLAGKSNFIVLTENGYDYLPNPTMPVRFKLLNPNTGKVEDATFRVHSITGGNLFYSPPPLYKQVLNMVKKEEGNNEWSINKRSKLINGRNYDYFTLNKETFGEVITGEILNIEFLPLEIGQ